MALIAAIVVVAAEAPSGRGPAGNGAPGCRAQSCKPGALRRGVRRRGRGLWGDGVTGPVLQQHLSVACEASSCGRLQPVTRAYGGRGTSRGSLHRGWLAGVLYLLLVKFLRSADSVT